jgi:hypothetical protein
VTHQEIEDIVKRATLETLAALGFDTSKPLDLQADMAHLRKWRKSVEQIERVGWGAIVTTLIGGGLGALWLGFKDLIQK